MMNDTQSLPEFENKFLETSPAEQTSSHIPARQAWNITMNVTFESSSTKLTDMSNNDG